LFFRASTPHAGTGVSPPQVARPPGSARESVSARLMRCLPCEASSLGPIDAAVRGKCIRPAHADDTASLRGGKAGSRRAFFVFSGSTPHADTEVKPAR
jgi:hypothetical protein